MCMTPLPVDLRGLYDAQCPDVYPIDPEVDIRDEDFEYELSLEE